MNTQSILLLILVAVAILYIGRKIQLHIWVYAVMKTTIDMITKVEFSFFAIWAFWIGGIAATIAFGTKGLILALIPLFYTRAVYYISHPSDDQVK